MIHLGVIGYGYWGPNIVRNFNRVDNAKVVSICDLNKDMLDRARKDFSGIDVSIDPNEICCSPAIDAIAIVTPVFTHFDLAKKALENGKHIFVEKPFTYTAAQAEELIELADKKNLKIMVDHTFLFTGAVKKIKELIDNNNLGNLYYFDSTRVNLGLFQHDVNVVWDLAPHDLAIMDYVIKEQPTALVTTGISHINEKFEDIAYITVYFSSSLIAHFNVNWLSPVKVRSTLIGGDKKMVVWNDIDEDQKIRVYDKGVEVKTRKHIYDLLVSYRSGDMWIPKIDKTEALALEAKYFIDCITDNKTPMNDGASGLRVVRMLEACNKSLKQKGALVTL
jgi:predicted dehydrogenase